MSLKKKRIKEVGANSENLSADFPLHPSRNPIRRLLCKYFAFLIIMYEQTSNLLVERICWKLVELLLDKMLRKVHSKIQGCDTGMVQFQDKTNVIFDNLVAILHFNVIINYCNTNK